MKIYLSIIFILICACVCFGQQTDREKAVELYRAGDTTGAIPLFQNVVENDTRDRPAWLYLAMSLVKTGKTREAMQAFNKSQAIHLSDKEAAKYREVLDKPRKLISRPAPNFAAVSRGTNLNGTITLALEFNANGTITLAVPITPLPNDIAKDLINTAQSIKFEPAVKNGKPITTLGTIEYNSESF